MRQGIHDRIGILGRRRTKVRITYNVSVSKYCLLIFYLNSSTLQLLLPDDISESLFTTLAGMVPSVFHVANPKILVDTNNTNNTK